MPRRRAQRTATRPSATTATALVYNLFPLLAGPFTAWTPHMQRASELGFNWLFVNPVQRTGESGSLYSIADYFAFNPLLVDTTSPLDARAQLLDAIAQAGRLGLRVLADLVVNHCAADSDLVRRHPEWFSWENGRVRHPFAMDDGRKVVWTDLARFDHGHSRDTEGLFRYFQDVVRFLIDCGFSGFRCDAAYQVPGRFWSRLIRETKAEHPDVLFFAETLGSSTAETRRTAAAGFDYIFNSSKWWDFTSPWLMEQYHLTRQIAPSVSFPESHDTERLATEVRGNVAALRQRYLFAALFSAAVMIPIGFEYGFHRRLHVVKTRQSDWETASVDLTGFIEEVNGIKSAHAVFREESITQVLPYGNPRVLLMWKASPAAGEEALLILNTDPEHRQPFAARDLRAFVQSGAPLVDCSPGSRLDYLPCPFSYDLEPGQGLVLVAGDGR